MKTWHKILSFPVFFIAGFIGLLTFFVVEGFKIGYTHYRTKGF